MLRDDRYILRSTMKSLHRKPRNKSTRGLGNTSPCLYKTTVIRVFPLRNNPNLHCGYRVCSPIQTVTCLSTQQRSNYVTGKVYPLKLDHEEGLYLPVLKVLKSGLEEVGIPRVPWEVQSVTFRILNRCHILVQIFKCVFSFYHILVLFFRISTIRRKTYNQLYVFTTRQKTPQIIPSERMDELH